MLAYKLNWKRKDQKDRRDFKVTRHLKVDIVPSEFSPLIKFDPFDQEDLGSCVANSGVLCAKYEIKQYFPTVNIDLSRLFLYYNTRVIEGTINEDSGAYIPDSFKAMSKQGICLESLYPYNTHKFTQKPSDSSYTDGLKHMPLRYTNVPQELSTIQKTLISGCYVSFGIDVYSSFMDKWPTDVMPIPKPGETFEGGHCLTIVGYSNSRQCFLIQNSWGKSWGNQGSFWMPYSYALGSHSSDFYCLDGFILKDDPTPQPGPSNDHSDLKNIFQSEADLNLLSKGLLSRMCTVLNLNIQGTKPKIVREILKNLK